MSLAQEWRVVAALGRRATSVQFRRAQLLMPTFVLPLMLLAVIASGTSAAQGLDDFPDVASYLTFVVPGTIVQGTILAGLTAGIAMASDIEFGFFDRLLAAPVRRTSLVLGRLWGTLVLALLQASFFLVVALLFGADYPGGVAGAVATVGLAGVTAVGMGGVSAAIALRTGSLSLLQSLFPFMFVLLFTAPAFFPQELLTPVLRDAADFNPLTYVVEAVRGLLAGDPELGDPWLGLAAAGGHGDRHHRALDLRAAGAAAPDMTAAVALTLWRRSLNEVLRVRGALLPATVAPVVFMLGMSGQFGRLTGLDGFPTDSYLSWIVPLSCLQGAGFAGAATGSNLARDIEQGWFDRLLVAPVPRPLLVIGPILGAVTRSLVPATVVLLVGLAIGAELPGGVVGVVLLYVASASFCAVAALWGIYLAVTFRTQQAGPLMQQGVFLAVFLSTAYTPEVLLRGWLAAGRRVQPDHVRARDGPAGDRRRDRAEPRQHVAGGRRAARSSGLPGRARRGRAAPHGPLTPGPAAAPARDRRAARPSAPSARACPPRRPRRPQRARVRSPAGRSGRPGTGAAGSRAARRTRAARRSSRR